jgi:hypothetical protein
MSGGIFLLRGDDDLVEMTEQPYDSEDILQALIARFPSLLAGDQLDSTSPRRWVLLDREAALPDDEDAAGRWSVDHLFIDQDAIPTLVEVKRSSDTRIRREVIGQILDYAANAVVYWPVERLRGIFEARCTLAGRDPAAELAPVVDDDGDAEAFWERAGANLRAGRVRLVFVADEIPRELRRVVEFLNGQMNPAEVIAIEVRQYVGPGMKTLVPRVIGQTAEVEARKGRRAARGTRQWDIESIVAELESNRSSAEARVARELHDWVLERGWRPTFRRGAVDGSFIPVLEPAGRDRKARVSLPPRARNRRAGETPRKFERELPSRRYATTARGDRKARVSLPPRARNRRAGETPRKFERELWSPGGPLVVQEGFSTSASS